MGRKNSVLSLKMVRKTLSQNFGQNFPKTFFPGKVPPWYAFQAQTARDYFRDKKKSDKGLLGGGWGKICPPKLSYGGNIPPNGFTPHRVSGENLICGVTVLLTQSRVNFLEIDCRKTKKIDGSRTLFLD